MTALSYRAEVWQLPHESPWGRLAPRLRYSHLACQIEKDDVGYGRVTFDGTDAALVNLIIDTDNDHGSVIRVFDDEDTNIFTFFAESLEQNYSEGGPAETVVHGQGIASILDKMVVLPFSGLEGNQHDWKWGAENKLTNPDFEDNAIVSKSFDLVIRAVGGTYTLFDGTMPADVTSAIAYNASAATIENRIETDLDRYNDVVVVQTDTNPTTFRIEMIDPPYGLNLGINLGSLVGSVYLLTIDGTGGDFTLSDGVDDTSAIAYNATAATIETRIQNDITSIIDVAVTDLGNNEDGNQMFDIRFINPTTGTLTVDDSGLTGGGAGIVSLPLATTTAVEEGGQTPTGWTKTQTLIGVNVEGTYDQWVFSDNRNHTPGGTYSLAIEPGAPGATSNRNLGAQQTVSVTAGAIHQAGIWVYPLGAADEYRLGLFTRGEEVIAWTNPGGQTLTPNTWNLLSLNDVMIPDGVEQVTFRIANTNIAPFNPSVFYVDDAYFYEGQPATTIGDILLSLADPIQTRGAGDWLDLSTISIVTDSNGATWSSDEEALNIQPGQTLLQFLDFCRDRGYEWKVVWSGSAFSLRIYNHGGMGIDQTGVLTFHPREGWQGQQAWVQSLPPYSAVFAEGNPGVFAYEEDASMVAGYGRWEGAIRSSGVGITQTPTLVNWAVQELDRVVTQRFSARLNMRARNEKRFGTDWDLGDTATFAFSGSPIGERAERIHSVQLLVTGDDEVNISYSVDFVKAVLLEPLGGTTSAPTSYILNALLRKFRRRIDTPVSSAVPIITGGGGGELSVTVAAADASDFEKKKADLVCDGVNDDEEIMTAAEMIGSGKIKLSSGQFRVRGNQIDFGTGGPMWVEGSGDSATIIILDDDITNASAINASFGSDLTVSNLWMFGGTGITAGRRAIDSANTDSLRVMNVGIYNFPTSIYVGGSDETFIHNVRTYQTGYSVYAPNNASNAIFISDCHFASGSIDLNNTWEVFIENNYIAGSIRGTDAGAWTINNNMFGGGGGIEGAIILVGRDFSGGALEDDVCVISGNLCEGGAFWNFIKAEDMNHVSVHDNHSAFGGMVFYDSKVEVYGNSVFQSTTIDYEAGGTPLVGGLFFKGCEGSVHNNEIDRAIVHGYEFVDCVSMQIHDNHTDHDPESAFDATYSGVVLKGSSTDMKVYNNHFKANPSGDDFLYSVSDETSNVNYVVDNWLGGLPLDLGAGTVIERPSGGASGSNYATTGGGGGGGGGPSPSFVTFSQAGTLTTGAGVSKMVFPVAATILEVQLAVATSPTGADLIVDVHKNGTTIFTTQANRPRVVDGDADGVGSSASADVTSVSEGQYLTVDIDQVGSTVAGADLTVVIVWEPV